MSRRKARSSALQRAVDVVWPLLPDLGDLEQVHPALVGVLGGKRLVGGGQLLPGRGVGRRASARGRRGRAAARERPSSRSSSGARRRRSPRWRCPPRRPLGDAGDPPAAVDQIGGVVRRRRRRRRCRRPRARRRLVSPASAPRVAVGGVGVDVDVGLSGDASLAGVVSSRRRSRTRRWSSAVDGSASASPVAADGRRSRSAAVWPRRARRGRARHHSGR